MARLLTETMSAKVGPCDEEYQGTGPITASQEELHNVTQIAQESTALEQSHCDWQQQAIQCDHRSRLSLNRTFIFRSSQRFAAYYR